MQKHHAASLFVIALSFSLCGAPCGGKGGEGGGGAPADVAFEWVPKALPVPVDKQAKALLQLAGDRTPGDWFTLDLRIDGADASTFKIANVATEFNGNLGPIDAVDLACLSTGCDKAAVTVTCSKVDAHATLVAFDGDTEQESSVSLDCVDQVPPAVQDPKDDCVVDGGSEGPCPPMSGDIALVQVVCYKGNFSLSVEFVDAASIDPAAVLTADVTGGGQSAQVNFALNPEVYECEMTSASGKSTEGVKCGFDGKSLAIIELDPTALPQMTPDAWAVTLKAAGVTDTVSGDVSCTTTRSPPPDGGTGAHLHPCDVISAADVEGWTGHPVTQENKGDQVGLKVCHFKPLDTNGMYLMVSTWKGSDDKISGLRDSWLASLPVEYTVSPLSWGPDGLLATYESTSGSVAKARVHAYVIDNPDPSEQDIIVETYGSHDYGKVPLSTVSPAAQNAAKAFYDAQIAAQ